MAVVPISWAAATIWIRWLATFEIDDGDARDVYDDDLGPVRANRVQEVVGQLLGTLRVDHADDGQDEQERSRRTAGRGSTAREWHPAGH